MTTATIASERRAAPVAAVRDRAFARFTLASVALATLARLIALFAVGFRDDEAYVVVLQRQVALSYFDHPPLHHWILHVFAHAFGEGRVDRLPFLALNLATGFALFGLARRLFGAATAWRTLFAFNACLYFLALPEGYILPDQPALAGLAFGVWAVAEGLYGPPGREGRLWALAGLAFGLAGLSKYCAVFAPLCLLGFLAVSPQHRRWLVDPRPYLGAALGLAVVAPAILWNAEHGWASFAFQARRAASGLAFDAAAWRRIGDGLVAQLGMVTPWMFVLLAAGLWQGLRAPRGSPGAFLIWLAAPPLAYFAAMPLLGQRAMLHWFDSAWLFAFPLAGLWLAERSAVFQRRFAYAAAALALAGLAIHAAAVNFGGGLWPSAPDPGRHNRDWPAAELRAIYARSGAAFALVDDWRTGGRLGVALGPEVAICALGPNPRGFAYACEAREHLGRDALVVRDAANGTGEEERAWFRDLEPLGELTVGPPGGHALRLILRAGRDLRQPPPLPYGP